MPYASGRGFQVLGRGLRGIGNTIQELERQRAIEDRQQRVDDVYMAQAGVLPEPISTKQPAEGFVPVGDWGRMQTPEARAAEERAALYDRLKAAYSDVPDLDPANVRAMARLTSEGAPTTGLMPDPNALSREDRLRVGGINPDTGMPWPRATTPQAPAGAPTYNQAMELLEKRYVDWVPNTETGEVDPVYRLSPAQMHDMATRMAAGEQVEWPALEAPGAGVPGEPTLVNKPGVRGWIERLLPFGESGKEIQMLPPPGQGMDAPPPSTVRPSVPQSSTRRAITQDQADYLRTVRGMSDDEIKRLYDVR